MAEGLGLFLGEDEPVCRWVEERLPYTPTLPRPNRAIGIVKDGRIIGGAVYHNYRVHRAKGKTASSIEISLVAEDRDWAKRWVVQALLRYPFVQLGVTRLNALVTRKNKTWRRQLKNLGFTEEGVLWRWYADDDAVFYGMQRDMATRWVGEQE